MSAKIKKSTDKNSISQLKRILSHCQRLRYHIIRECNYIVRDYVITSSESMLSHRQRVCYHIIIEYVITSSESMLSHCQRVCYHNVREYVITLSESMVSHVLSYWCFLDVRTMAGLDIFTIRGTTVASKGPTKWGPG